MVSVLGGWRRHRDVLGNTVALIAATAVTSALGAGYWAIAARLFTQQEVGLSSAAVSAMALLGTIGMLGLGTVLIGELPRRTIRAGLISAALLACALTSLVLGIGFAFIAPEFSRQLGAISASPELLLLLVLGTVLTGVCLLFDQASIGLLRGNLQLTRNFVLAVAKLIILIAIPFLLHSLAGVGIMLSWVAGLATSLAVVAMTLRLRGTPVLRRPDWVVLRGLGRATATHTWLNLALSTPQALFPVLVTVVISPKANAYFYAAWTISGFLRIVPIHLTTVLFAVTSADPRVIARKLRFTLRLSLLIGLVGMTTLILGAHLVLTLLFGPAYAQAGSMPLILFVAGYVPAISYTHYIAVCRATDRISRAAVVGTLALGAEIAALIAGGKADGLIGASLALLGAFTVEALVTTPAVVRAAFGHGRHRREAGEEPARRLAGGVSRPGARDGFPPVWEAAGTAAAASARDHDDKRAQQLMGLEVLLSLARSVNSTGAIPVITGPARVPEHADNEGYEYPPRNVSAGRGGRERRVAQPRR